MLNQVVLVGRLTSNVEVNTLENDKKQAIVTIAVPRSYKNINGEYDTDFIKCILWDGIATNTSEYCKKGDLVGIRGRLESTTSPDNSYSLELRVEKLTFLSSHKIND